MMQNDQTELLVRLKSSSTSERVWAAKNLRGDRSTLVLSALVDNLADDDPEVADACAESLLHTGGRSVALLLVNLLGVEQVVLRNRAKDLLWSLGAEAGDQLLIMLKDADPNLRLHAAELLGAVPGSQSSRALIDALNDPDPNVRAAAANSLGSKAEPSALPALLDKLDDEEWVRFAVIGALASIGDPISVDPLIAAMEKGSNLIKAKIIESLGLFTDPRIIDPLLNALPHSEGPLFSQILITLLKNSDAEQLILQLDQDLQDKIIPALTEALKDSSENVKEGALRCLALMSDPAAVYPILEFAGKQQNLGLHAEIINALLAIGSIAPLVSAAKDQRESLALAAVGTLGRVGGELAVQVLTEALRHNSVKVRCRAALHLGQLQAPEAETALLQALADEQVPVLLAVLRSLKGIAGPDSVKHLWGLLRHSNPEVRRRALDTLVKVNSPEVHRLFKKGLNDPDQTHRALCVEGLGRAGDEDADWQLLALLEDEQPAVRTSALRGLLSRNHQKHWERLAKSMDDPEPQVRHALVQFVVQKNWPAGEDVLIKGLGDSEPGIRLDSANGLIQLGGASAVDPLLGLLLSGDSNLRIAAAKALGAIKEPSSASRLMTLLMDPDPDVRATAVSALQSIEGGWG